MTSVNRAVAEATRAVNQALRDSYSLQGFKIVRFGRHRDGYLHAMVVIGDQPGVYVFERYGSWQIPAEPQPNYPNHDGPPLRDVVSPYTYALSDEARRFLAAERQRKEARDEHESPGGAEQPAGRDEAAQAA